MSKTKKIVREIFRSETFKRDGNKCRVCKRAGDLDAHHITDRNEMPNGGYVKENGISLCPACHIKAEHFHSTGVSLPDFSPDDLYKLIGSSKDKAHAASLRL